MQVPGPFEYQRATSVDHAVGAWYCTNGGLATRRSERALADDILASYNDRSASLVVTTFGGGTLAVLNADLTTSDLPRSTMAKLLALMA